MLSITSDAVFPLSLISSLFFTDLPRSKAIWMKPTPTMNGKAQNNTIASNHEASNAITAATTNPVSNCNTIPNLIPVAYGETINT